MAQPFAGTSPYLILFGFMLFMGFLFLIVMFSMQAGNRKKAKDCQLCVFVTKNKILEWAFLPIANGVIQSPPHHKFDKDKPRIYYTNKKFSLSTMYPPLIPKIFSLTQVQAWSSIYEEGDPAPILPSDEDPIDTPAKTKAITSQNIVPQVIQAFGKQFGGVGGGGLDLGKHKGLVIFGFIIILVGVLVSAYTGVQNLQGMQWLMGSLAPK